MAIGKFGKYITFEVYMDPTEAPGKKVKCLSFSGFNRTVSNRTTEHERITRKQKVQFNGPNISSMSFTIYLSVGLGVDPRKMIERLESCVRFGKAAYFVIGTKKVGKKKYIITNLEEEWEYIMKNGKLVGARTDITMKEYI